jgi:hypothetical protein
MNPQIVSTINEAKLHGVKALIYAKSGYGKTYLARTAPAPIILSAESGVLSLGDVNLPMIKVKTVQDLSGIYSWLTSSAEAKQFHTVYIDSITEIAEVVLTNAKNVVKDPRQAYAKLMDDMIGIIKAYRDISGKHVVMTAKEEANKDELTGIVLRGPMMPGNKVGQQLPYLFDEVFRLGVGKMPEGNALYRFIQTQPDLQYDAKDRSGKLDPVERPDLSFIFNKIIGA